jgi:hypothetical protein
VSSWSAARRARQPGSFDGYSIHGKPLGTPGKDLACLARRDPDAARAQLLETIYRAHGNMRRAGHFEGVDRVQIWRWLKRLGMMDVLADARAQAQRPEWLTAARKDLAMDEQLQTILTATAGMSAEEIEALIASSANASAVDDPGMLAAWLASQGDGSAS